VDHFVLKIFEREEHRGSTDVTFFEEVTFGDTVLASGQHVTTDVEFTTQVK
jgi:hypothetical protein